MVSTLFRLDGGLVDMNTNTFLLALERNFYICQNLRFWKLFFAL